MAKRYRFPEFEHDPSEYRACPGCQKFYLEDLFQGNKLCTHCIRSVYRPREDPSPRRLKVIETSPERKLTVRLRRYGLTEEQYLALLDYQEKRCYVCGEKKYLFIDHDHKTGEVRGLLCISHNTGLGFFQDNILHLERAISYLQNPPNTYINRDQEDI